MARTKKAETDQAETPKAGLATYVAQWHVTHDGQTYEPGDQIQLEAETAAPMIESGAIAAQ